MGQSGCGRGLRGLRPRGLPSAAARVFRISVVSSCCSYWYLRRGGRGSTVAWGPVGSAGYPFTPLFWVLFAFVCDGCDVCLSRVHRLGGLCFRLAVRI